MKINRTGFSVLLTKIPQRNGYGLVGVDTSQQEKKPSTNSRFSPCRFWGDKLGKNSVYERMTRAEKEVAELLKDLGIKWSYEHPVFVWDENKRPRVWAPDFYLSQFDIYIEVCGSNKFD